MSEILEAKIFESKKTASIKMDALVRMRGKSLSQFSAKSFEAGIPAGKEMMEYIVNNPYSPEAAELESGKRYFFFGAVSTRGVPFISKRNGRITQYLGRPDYTWDSADNYAVFLNGGMPR